MDEDDDEETGKGEVSWVGDADVGGFEGDDAQIPDDVGDLVNGDAHRD